MSPSHYAEALEPVDLHLLEIVFERICGERGLSRASADAEAIAANLVRLWESGLRDEEMLHTVAGSEARGTFV